MDVTYNASSSIKRAEIVGSLRRADFRATTDGARELAMPESGRRVYPGDEQNVGEAILAADPAAVPVIRPPSYTHG